MRITFGLGLDGNVWLPSLLEKTASVGECVVGPTGMLRILGTLTGNTKPHGASIQRMMAYLKALRKADSPSRFYHQSLKTDAFAVARHLLSIRDELGLAGWNRATTGDVSRLKDLAAVEAVLENCDGMADRLWQNIQSLQGISSVPIQALCLADPVSHFPKLWRDLIELLQAKGVDVSQRSSSEAGSGARTDLSIAQEFATGKKSAKPLRDASLLLLEGQDPWQAARWTAAWLERQEGSTVVVAPERSRRILAAAFAERNIAFGGEGGAYSAARPSVQLLLLSLAMAWAPKNPQYALAMLMLPVSPIPRWMRRELISALQEAPAVGSEEWGEAIETAHAKIEKEQGRKKADSAKERVLDFLGAGEFSPAIGIPAKDLAAICGRIANWSRAYGELQKQNSFKEAAALADAISGAIADSGVQTFAPEMLNRLILDIVGEGIRAEVNPARSGGPFVVSCPEAVLDHVDNLIWWDFSKGAAKTVGSSFWSRTDRELFRKQKIELKEPVERAVEASAGWMRALLSPRNKFFAVTFVVDAAHEVEHAHPLLDQLVPPDGADRKEWLGAIRVKPGVGTDKATKSFESELDAVSVSVAAPPWGARESWQAPKGALSLREVESASSLEKLLHCSLSYTLQYGAGLSGVSMEKLPEGNLLYGNIAHKVFENVFKVGERIGPDAAKAKAGTYLQELLPRYAALLLSPKNRSECIEMETTVLNAVYAYAKFVEENGYEVLGIETDLTDTFFAETKLNGAQDQVLGKKGTPSLVMDFKWGGRDKRYSLLKDGKALQLAIYSYLQRQTGGHPDVGFFILSEQKPMILNLRLKGAEYIEGKSIKDVYHDHLQLVQSKAVELASGAIVADGLKKIPKAEELANCRNCGFQGVCGLHWKEEV